MTPPCTRTEPGAWANLTQTTSIPMPRTLSSSTASRSWQCASTRAHMLRAQQCSSIAPRGPWLAILRIAYQAPRLYGQKPHLPIKPQQDSTLWGKAIGGGLCPIN